MTTETKASGIASKYSIYGMDAGLFAIVTGIILVVTFMGKLPKGMIGALALMITVGAVLEIVGNNLPIVKTFLGGGPIIIIFGSAAMATYGIFPEYSVEIMTDFMKSQGFLNFYIAALITGSILGMSRKLLIKASVRYIPAILGGVLVSLLGVGLVGALIGYGAKEAIYYIGIPIMGGGMGAGAVPLAEIFGGALNQDPKEVLSIMVPAVALGNATAIVAGGILHRVGEKYPNLTGNGNLIIPRSDSDEEENVLKQEDKKSEITLQNLATGMLMALSFYCVGVIISKFIPAIHSYAWMIISVAVVKMTNILPEKYEICAFQWFQLVMKASTACLLVGIGVAYTNLTDVISAFSLQYVVLVVVVVLGAIIGTGVVGRLVGFYPIETSLTAGLCMANMGGTGDVAVLSAAKRMELMPFAQISSRIGGAFMLLLASFLLKVL